MIPVFRRLKSEIAKRFNPAYLRYQILHEKKQMRRYLAGPARNDVGFSIVVPTYGIPLDFVRDFVRSIEKQSYTNWQLCICDDGDPNPEVANYLRKLAEEDPARFKFTQSLVNQGICAATKSALKVAEFDYVVLVDADDLLHRRALEIVARALATNPEADFLYSNHDYMTEWGLRLQPMTKPAWSPELLLHLNYINHLKIIRRDFLNEIADEAFDQKYNGAQDWSLCFQVMLKAKSVVHIPFFLYHWRARKGSMAHDMFAKPYAVEAQLKLRQHTVRQLSQDLEFRGDRNHCAITKIPNVQFINVSDIAAEHEPRDYLEALLALTLSGDAEFLHFGTRSPTDPAALADLAGYCTLPKIACAWPFQNSSVRLSYTVAPSADQVATLTPLEFHRGSYSWASGNILCGPLNGMTITRATFERLAAAVLAQPFPQNFTGEISDVIGVLLSTMALELGLRNVSVNLFAHDHVPGLVSLPDSFLPAFDPYL